MLTIRHANINDLDEILSIYDVARNFMKETGNPTQWSTTYPSRSLLTNDINSNNLYVLVDTDNTIQCVFMFFIGNEPTYEYIEGSWLNEKTYGTIHRIASRGIIKNTFKYCLDYCLKLNNNIRIDTHHDNKVMQHIIESNNFIKCGIVYMQDKSPRIAYQYNIKE